MFFCVFSDTSAMVWEGVRSEVAVSDEDGNKTDGWNDGRGLWGWTVSGKLVCRSEQEVLPVPGQVLVWGVLCFACEGPGAVRDLSASRVVLR